MKTAITFLFAFILTAQSFIVLTILSIIMIEWLIAYINQPGYEILDTKNNENI